MAWLQALTLLMVVAVPLATVCVLSDEIKCRVLLSDDSMLQCPSEELAIEQMSFWHTLAFGAWNLFSCARLHGKSLQDIHYMMNYAVDGECNSQ